VLKVNLLPSLDTDERSSLPIGSQNRTLMLTGSPAIDWLGYLACAFRGVSDGIRTRDIQDHKMADPRSFLLYLRSKDQVGRGSW
jgi:hypothetical protein